MDNGQWTMDNGHKARPMQTLVDLAIIHCGSAEAAIDIALMNGMAIDEDPYRWEQEHGPLSFPEVYDERTAGWYALSGHPQPATALETEVGGINYMGIEIDFIVS